MKKKKYRFETVLSNSELTDESKQLLVDSFSKLSDHEKFTFVALIEDDPSKLQIAVDFLAEFSSQNQLKALDTEEYLLSVTQK